MSAGTVVFAGCGPGAADLLTLRAARALESADVVIWSPSLLDRRALAAHIRSDAEIVEWPPATARDVLAVFDRAAAEGLTVVRLSGGDPMLFGALQPELSAVRERGLDHEVVPGVTAAGAGAAALGHELATKGAPLLLVDAATLVDAPGAEARIAVYGVGGHTRADAVQHALLRRGLPPSTRCTVAIELSRRDEILESCSLEELGETVDDLGRGVLTLVLAGVPGETADASGAGPQRVPNSYPQRH